MTIELPLAVLTPTLLLQLLTAVQALGFAVVRYTFSQPENQRVEMHFAPLGDPFTVDLPLAEHVVWFFEQRRLRGELTA